ncbi:MAG: Hsp20/alpha crystallin family protein [Bacilli bacterium]|nr:Hsp20/alpha crystallin family protein [Bacilli bacterium]
MVFRNRNNQIDLWNGNLFSDLFEDSFAKRNVSLMKTDIREDDDKYTFEVDLPGMSKEDIKISIEDGYLTIETKKEEQKEVRNDKEIYIRRERRFGNFSRSYYLGEVQEDTVHAAFENGVLKIDVFKQKEPIVETKKYITIK